MPAGPYTHSSNCNPLLSNNYPEISIFIVIFAPIYQILPSLKHFWSTFLIGAATLLYDCAGTSHPDNKKEIRKDTTLTPPNVALKYTAVEVRMPTNDSLNAISSELAGLTRDSNLPDSLKGIMNAYASQTEKRWHQFDTSRLKKIEGFSFEISGKIPAGFETLLYPFSGPDILYGQTFFPNVKQYVLVGLEPVGYIPDFRNMSKDTLKAYCNEMKASLGAILNFSFFRTKSMKSDLSEGKLRGTLPLLLFFLRRNGNLLCTLRYVSLSDEGLLQYADGKPGMRTGQMRPGGVEIVFQNKLGHQKKLYYFSRNLSNEFRKKKRGLDNFIASQSGLVTFLKSASYLLHAPYFSIFKEVILKNSSAIVEDDSGIPLYNFRKGDEKWEVYLYGKYRKPIKMFDKKYQSDLDSLYKLQGSSDLGFGLGYNFKDKNSNLLIAVKKKI